MSWPRSLGLVLLLVLGIPGSGCEAEQDAAVASDGREEAAAARRHGLRPEQVQRVGDIVALQDLSPEQSTSLRQLAAAQRAMRTSDPGLSDEERRAQRRAARQQLQRALKQAGDSLPPSTRGELRRSGLNLIHVARVVDSRPAS